MSACGDAPGEQEPVCVPCEGESVAVGEGAMEVGSENGAGETADGAAGVEVKGKVFKRGPLERGGG